MAIEEEVSCLRETTHIRAIMWSKLEPASQGPTVCVAVASPHLWVSMSLKLHRKISIVVMTNENISLLIVH